MTFNRDVNEYLPQVEAGMLIRFLAKLLDIPRSSVQIVRGASSRAKDVLLSRTAIDAGANRLALGSHSKRVGS